MRQLTLLTLFVVCSLSLSCKNKGPDVIVCLVDSFRNELQCSDSLGNKFVIPMNEAENYVCLSPEDFQLILNYARNRCQ